MRKSDGSEGGERAMQRRPFSRVVAGVFVRWWRRCSWGVCTPQLHADVKMGRKVSHLNSTSDKEDTCEVM